MTAPSPHHSDAEKAALATVVTYPETVYQLLAELRETDFWIPAHRHLYAALAKLAETGKPFDVISVESTLTALHGDAHRRLGLDVIDLATRYTSIPEILETHIAKVKECSVRRRIIEINGIYSGRASDLADNADELFADFQNEAMGITLSSEKRDGTAATLVAELLKDFERRRLDPREIPGVSFGLKPFDKLTGGACEGHIIVIAARPGVGKTAFAMNNCVMHACVELGLPTLVFSLEMNAKKLMERMIAARCGITQADLKRGEIISEQYSRIYASRLAEAPLYIEDRGALTISQIAAQARQFRANPAFFPKGKTRDLPTPGLIVVDYVQLARSPEFKKVREQEIADIMRGLKAIAKSTGFTILALAQMNRDREKGTRRRPQLSDLRESGAIEQDADVVAFLDREVMKPEAGAELDEHRLQPNQALLIAPKSRHEETGEAALRWYGDLSRFGPWTAEPDEGQDRAWFR